MTPLDREIEARAMLHLLLSRLAAGPDPRDWMVIARQARELARLADHAASDPRQETTHVAR